MYRRKKIRYHRSLRGIFHRKRHRDKPKTLLIFPQEQINRIVKATSLLILMEERIILTKTNSGDYTGHCPFCRGNGNRYFRYSPFYGLWKCFGCGIGGRNNPVNFYARYHKIPFDQALFLINKNYHNSRYELTGTLKSTCTDDGLPF